MLHPLQLLQTIAPECVDTRLVLPGGSAGERKSNATYAISCAHKMGCRVFLGWEDLVEVQPKMVLSILAAAMAVDMRRNNLSRDALLEHLAAASQARGEAAIITH